MTKAKGRKTKGTPRKPVETQGATFHLMGRFELPSDATPVLDLRGETCGFKLANGCTYRIQVALEEESADGESHKDLGSCECEALGVFGFGELDVKDLRIGEE
jgi:hypothetical protein